MIAPRQFYCEACEAGWTIRAAADSPPRCPGCRRDSLVMVNAPTAAQVTPEYARRAFATMRDAIAQSADMSNAKA